jgi:uncharacterized membrane protein
MRRILLSLLVIVLILGAVGAAGFAGYQFGLRQGGITSSSGNPQLPPGHPDIGPHSTFRDGPGFHQGFGGGFGMMGHGMGFGFLSPLFFLLRLAFWALVIWAVYMLITQSGWRLTRDTTTTTTVNPAPPAETYTKVETTDTKTE